MKTIYVVEDDDSIREMVAYALTTAGFHAVDIEDGELALSMLQKELPALMLLDIMLPGMDGLDILRTMKQSRQFRAVPVIMLTAKGGEMDRIKGLDLGADDYVTKPFSVMEVISRVNAVLRRCSGEEESRDGLRCGDIELHPARRAVFVNGEEASLTYKEFELLQYLLLNENIVLSRDRLLDHVWGYDYDGESRTVDMHIKTLRQKLGEAGSVIKTVRNVGYKIGS